MNPRHPYEPRPVAIQAAEGRPLRVGKLRVDSVREQWLVEDRWWSEQPLRRHYFELVLEDGRCTVVFRDLGRGGWYAQR